MYIYQTKKKNQSTFIIMRREAEQRKIKKEQKACDAALMTYV